MHSSYLRLMRLHQPVGIWLLLWPCWWSVELASPAFPDLRILALFAVGAVLMRSAGCIINDLADRRFDALVERTRARPLASGELSAVQALTLLIVLLVASLPIAMALGNTVLLWSALALPPIAIYPWMKRISWWPQLFLGLAFNWGALMGWAAVHGTVEPPAIILYLGCLCWTLGYDTIYAHQDKKDDALIGLRSTALRLGARSKPVIALFYALAIACWMAASILAGHNYFTLLLLLLPAVHLFWQVCSVTLDSPLSCRRFFVSNAYLGLLVFIAFMAGK